MEKLVEAKHDKACRAAPGNTLSGCLLLLRAWAAEDRRILGHAAVADGLHEIAVVSDLLQVLESNAALVALHAAWRQKGNAEQVRVGGGDYLLAVKGNQPSLQSVVMAAFDRACEAEFAAFEYDGHEAVEDGQGRHGERHVTAIYDPEGLPPEWPDVAAVVLVGRERQVAGRTPAPSPSTS